MVIEKHGSPKNKCIVLIHGSFVTGEMWKSEVEFLKKDFYVLVPTLNGHNPEETVDFPGVEQEAKNLIIAIKEQHEGEIFAIVGSSLGGTIALEMIANNSLSIKHIVSDGGFFTPISPVIALIGANLMTSAMMIIKNGNQKKTPLIAKSLSRSGAEMFQRTISIISRTSINNIFRSTYQYKLPDKIDQTPTRINIWYGSRENYFVKKSARDIRKRAPLCIIREFIGMKHGELALDYPDRYVQEINNL
jgi:pimeloyl-ACP methyl ester carboxylesterase